MKAAQSWIELDDAGILRKRYTGVEPNKTILKCPETGDEVRVIEVDFDADKVLVERCAPHQELG